jgi:hypothetical protein
LAIHHEAERDTSDYVIGIVVDVEGAYVAFETDGSALAGRRQEGLVLMLGLAEHDLAGARAERERA